MTSAAISPETSARVCAHMNDDHAATIHAMVMLHLSQQNAPTLKIQNVKMESDTMSEYNISYIFCNGESC